MNKSIRIISTVVLIAILIWLLVAMVKGRGGQDIVVEEQNEQATDQEVAQVITVQRKKVDGVHTIQGLIETPTPCHAVDAIAKDSGYKEITVDITSTKSDDDICGQAITPTIFQTSYTADDDTTILGTFNGRTVTFNFVDLAPDEEFRNFDGFIK